MTKVKLQSLVEISSNDYIFGSYSLGKFIRLFMCKGEKHLIENMFEKVFYRFHKFYRFGSVLLNVITRFRRDYILEKRRRGRKFIYIPRAISYLKRELLALKYFRNRIFLSKSRNLISKIISGSLTLFFSKKSKLKDFEEMQNLLKENVRYAHFRWNKKKKRKLKRFFPIRSNY